MKKALLFDTETTGMFDFKSRYDAEHQPFIMQLAMRLVQEDGQVLGTLSLLIRPDERYEPDKVEPGAQSIHGLSHAMCQTYGTSATAALNMFCSWARAADVIVAHNIQFDSKMICREFVAANHSGINMSTQPKFCTMQQTTNLCALPGGRGGYKWPKLVELHEHLFGEPFAGAHDALVDIMATERCFLELIKRGEISWEQF